MKGRGSSSLFSEGLSADTMIEAHPEAAVVAQNTVVAESTVLEDDDELNDDKEEGFKMNLRTTSRKKRGRECTFEVSIR